MIWIFTSLFLRDPIESFIIYWLLSLFFLELRSETENLFISFPSSVLTFITKPSLVFIHNIPLLQYLWSYQVNYSSGVRAYPSLFWLVPFLLKIYHSSILIFFNFLLNNFFSSLIFRVFQKLVPTQLSKEPCLSSGIITHLSRTTTVLICALID